MGSCMSDTYSNIFAFGNNAQLNTNVRIAFNEG